jgi:Family of unknown function (DUF5691)
VTGYRELVAAATVGLAQRPLRVTDLPEPAAEHVTVVDVDPAGGLLDAIALLDAAQRASAPSASPMPLPARAADDRRPELRPGSARIVAELLASGPADVLGDLLQAAGQAGFRAPAPLLPSLLSAAAVNSTLREPVVAALGERGRWLAAQQPEWRRLLGAVSDDAWQVGSLAERRLWLGELRRRDPDAARRLLAEGWAHETGEGRADLITVLADGLTTADESFLEAALDDRKAEVRRQAAHLLQVLGGSAYQARARARAETVLQIEHGRLVAVPPDEPDEEARRDGLDARPRGPRAGAKSWLLTQLIASAPLEVWAEILGGDPCRLVAIPVADDRGPEVHGGWRRAAVRQRNLEWARALLDVSEELPRPAGPPFDEELAALLPHVERQARAAALLRRRASAARLVAEVHSCPPPWAGPLGEAFLNYLEAEVRRARSVPISPLLATAARAVPTNATTDYAALLRGLADDAPVTTAWPHLLRRTAGIVELRRRFHEEL